MRFEDVDQVSEVERECFTTPWPTSAYRRELRDNRMGRYIVLAEVTENASPAEVSTVEANESPAMGVRRAVEHLFRPFGRAAVTSNERIVGFAGMWLMLDEAHVTTIGVKRDLRGHGLGELLFATLIDIATAVSASRVTLEVRVSNVSAQNLYRKYGFHEEGIRRRYYSDNGEDALIMWSDYLNRPEFQAHFAQLKGGLWQRLGEVAEVHL
jgi:ribosomal-protein-alanine N-acetyltransferase